ncbi:hypothetical protein LshimejAT787_0111400 [Lyophyllum shimeji]|uniref:Uncharacterized protein n=1 Tax=Lyophyllum shimeji TaxID=47721 RepID=A0A9P3UKC5_LYOSH|nr:hypothetical protein LshimejAT787_0111400 [Lyophyllum shimeji]
MVNWKKLRHTNEMHIFCWLFGIIVGKSPLTVSSNNAHVTSRNDLCHELGVTVSSLWQSSLLSTCPIQMSAAADPVGCQAFLRHDPISLWSCIEYISRSFSAL